MFEIKNLKATVTNINPRAELHGEDTFLACDVSLTLHTSNQIMDELAPGLKAAFYQGEPRQNSDPQSGLDLVDDYLPHLRFPCIKRFGWTFDGTGYEVVIHGEPGVADIVLTGCKVNQIKLEPQDGGSVKLSLRIQAAPSESLIAQLCHHIQNEVDVTITPPEEAAPDRGQATIGGADYFTGSDSADDADDAPDPEPVEPVEAADD